MISHESMETLKCPVNTRGRHHVRMRHNSVKTTHDTNILAVSLMSSARFVDPQKSWPLWQDMPVRAMEAVLSPGTGTPYGMFRPDFTGS